MDNTPVARQASTSGQSSRAARGRRRVTRADRKEMVPAVRGWSVDCNGVQWLRPSKVCQDLKAWCCAITGKANEDSCRGCQENYRIHWATPDNTCRSIRAEPPAVEGPATRVLRNLKDFPDVGRIRPMSDPLVDQPAERVTRRGDPCGVSRFRRCRASCRCRTRSCGHLPPHRVTSAAERAGMSQHLPPCAERRRGRSRSTCCWLLRARLLGTMVLA